MPVKPVSHFFRQVQILTQYRTIFPQCAKNIYTIKEKKYILKPETEQIFTKYQI